MEDDLALLAAWRDGDRQAGSKLLQGRIREITWFFRNKVANEADVADLVGQTFLGSVTSKDRFRGDASFRQFLYAVAHNTLRNYLRTRSKRDRELLDFAAVCVGDLLPRTPSSIQVHRRELRAFVDALRCIPLEDQIVLELKYFEGLAGGAIADVLGVAEGTVRSRLRRGLARLRAEVATALRSGGRETQMPTEDDLEAWAAAVRASREPSS